MNIRSMIKALHKFARKRRCKPLAYSFPIIKNKGSRMSDKVKNAEKIQELQMTLDNQAELLAETIKLVSTLRREVTEQNKTILELKQLCSVGQ